MGRPGDENDAVFFAEEFAQVRRMLQGRTVEEFSQLPLVRRKSIFGQYLVQPQRVIIEEGDDGHEMNPAIANGVLLLQQLFMGEDGKGKQMVKEAREVYYGENEFLVRLHWLCEFQCDQYDIDTGPVPIAPLVRRLVVVTNLHDKYDWEDDTEDNPCYPCDGIGDGEGNMDPNHIRPSGDIVARRTRKRLEELFLFINAEEITLVLRGGGPPDGSDAATRQTIADISVTVKRLIEFFGNRFAIQKWPDSRSRPTRNLVSYWNKPTDLTRRDIREGRASFQQQMQMDVERWTREPVTIKSRS
ncbi:hypothetical protein Forpe1208_v016712 [Fusarium oxysporum f. sp. rapae]|uniref:Uncharacterized protein n=1 Tax=Fusarium oxysporum f. sp. rapae TaxID=485398 RepID=A0A8J5NHD2_FUSOX|nr:hypothetical protein Forpe1208_v016712 [Fusarium oxysporum f. sp. rapae]